MWVTGKVNFLGAFHYSRTFYKILILGNTDLIVKTKFQCYYSIDNNVLNRLKDNVLWEEL